jgi:hypothetical protein
MIALSSQAQLANDSAVTLDIVVLQVVEEVSSVTDHLLKTAAAMEVVLVCLQMLGERCNSVGQKCDLHLRRTGVSLVGCVLLDNALLFVFQHGFYFTFLFFLALTQQSVGEEPQNISHDRNPKTERTSFGIIIPHLPRFVKGFYKNIFAN